MLQIQSFGHLAAALQCSPLDISTQCGQIGVTVAISIGAAVTVSITAKPPNVSF